MSRSQPPGFWGTGAELSAFREGMDPVEARRLVAGIGGRLFAGRFGYHKVAFRSLYLPVVLVDLETMEEFEITPADHLMGPDGKTTGIVTPPWERGIS